MIANPFKGVYCVSVILLLFAELLLVPMVEAKELNAQVRDYVRRNADKLFERLEKEEDKRTPR